MKPAIVLDTTQATMQEPAFSMSLSGSPWKPSQRSKGVSFGMMHPYGYILGFEASTRFPSAGYCRSHPLALMLQRHHDEVAP